MNRTSLKSNPSEAVDLTELLKVQPKLIDVAFLPTLIEPSELCGRTAVVADVLRATTTAIQALLNGCAEVIPQPTIEGARELHQRLPNSVLGGERGGRIIPGFHHGNSPLEYVRERIAGKSVILATTNGTVAMERCRQANRILIGALNNLGAVAAKIAATELITIVCSGTDGEITSEDTLFAGALVERILLNRLALSSPVGQSQDKLDPTDYHELLSDRALIAIDHWQVTCRRMAKGKRLADFFRVARGGVNLVKIGMDADIEFAAQIDTVTLVPELNLQKWAIA